MSSWTKCAAGHRPGTAFGSTCNTFPKSSGPENLLQLVGRRDLELVVTAVLGLFVRPPALKHRRVPEPIALQVIVLHLGDALDAERLPRHIFAAAPAALRAGHAARFGLRVRPFAPRVVYQRIFAEWRQFLHELLAHRHRE